MPINNMQNPRYALSSSLVPLHQLLYFSSSITSFAYRFVCSTMSSSRSCVNIRSKVSIGDAGISTEGPTGELKAGMVIGVRVDD